MSAGSTAAALPYRPDPPPDPAVHPAAASAPAPSRTGRLLGLVRKLIDYGKDLAHTLQQRTAATALFTVALHFGTRDIALILARISRGLLLANALEARLVSRPEREAAAAALVRAPPDRARRAAQPAVLRAGGAASGLALVPTAEEIAAALRHRPAAAVIADICRDLGIVPAHPLWGEVMMVLTEHGGSIVTLFKDVLDRVCAWFADPSAVEQDGWPAAWEQAAVACGTGPP
jgi:hypothetical protein